MVRVLFSSLFLMSAFCLSNAQYAEFEKVTDGYVKMTMDGFYVELGNNPTAQGYIINYGTDNEITYREKQFRRVINWRRFDPARVTFVRGGLWKNPRTEMWIVPESAEKPSPSLSAELHDEFGKIPDEELSARIDNFYVLLADSNSNGLIVNYGSAKAVAAMENRIKKISNRVN